VPDRLVIGIGNPDRGDDGVGRAVVRMLQHQSPAYVRIEEQDGEATALIAALQSAAQVWLVDAASSGAAAGTVHRIDCAMPDVVLPAGGVSSHGFGVAEAIELARTLGVLPWRCILYAVEANGFAPGAALSSAVADAAREVAEKILQELRLP
jgi:hydrogenase maturation protease